MEPVTNRFDGYYPNRVLQFEFEFLANAAMILGDMYFLADLEARLCHEASRGEGFTLSPRRTAASLPHDCFRVVFIVKIKRGQSMTANEILDELGPPPEQREELVLLLRHLFAALERRDVSPSMPRWKEK